MENLIIKLEKNSQRCEICHQVDCYDPINDLCTRCLDIKRETAPTGESGKDGEIRPVEEKSPPVQLPASRWGRIFLGVITILLPIICFLLGEMFMPDYQGDRFLSYTGIMLGHAVTLIFSPLLIYSITCIALLLIKPQRFAQYFMVRLGIYAAPILSLQYSIILGISVFKIKNIFSIETGECLLFAAITCSGLILLNKLFVKFISRIKPRYILLATISAAILLSGNILVNGNLAYFGPPVEVTIFISLLSAPFWCFVITGSMALGLLKYQHFSNQHMFNKRLAVYVWSATFFSAWTLAISKAIEIYNLLPPEKADCYIATAAAQGDAWLVKSWPVVVSNGALMSVNAQLQYLKCGELAIKAIAPRLHRAIRYIYDRIGPRLARCLKYALLADLAYLSLKPFEWSAKILLRLLVKNIDALAQRVYTLK